MTKGERKILGVLLERLRVSSSFGHRINSTSSHCMFPTQIGKMCGKALFQASSWACYRLRKLLDQGLVERHLMGGVLDHQGRDCSITERGLIMAGLREIARDAGCDKVRCENCGKYTHLYSVLPALFKAIVERVRRDETVRIPGFGLFRRRIWKGRVLGLRHIRSQQQIQTDVPDRVSMRFQLSSRVREDLNSKPELKRTGGKKGD